MLGVCPPPEGHEFRIVRVPQEDLGDKDGDCGKHGRVFTVRVSRDLTVGETVETLIHEVAHAYDWRPYSALGSDHGATWGVWYARVYGHFHHVR